MPETIRLRTDEFCTLLRSSRRTEFYESRSNLEKMLHYPWTCLDCNNRNPWEKTRCVGCGSVMSDNGNTDEKYQLVNAPDEKEDENDETEQFITSESENETSTTKEDTSEGTSEIIGASDDEEVVIQTADDSCEGESNAQTNAIDMKKECQYVREYKKKQKVQPEGRDSKKKAWNIPEKLSNFNRSGLHDHGSINNGDVTWICEVCEGRNNTLYNLYFNVCQLCGIRRSSTRRPKEGDVQVVINGWNESRTCIGEKNDVFLASHPLLYERDVPPPALTRLCDKLLTEINKDVQNDLKLKKSKMFEPLKMVSPGLPGYFKSHLKDSFVKKKLMNKLPLDLMVKDTASQKGIIFANIMEVTCPTHYDRDTSILLLLKGTKEVYLAKKAPIKKEVNLSNSSILDQINPFKGERGGLDWRKCCMTPGDALLIPRDWIHCIKSAPLTIALSLQVQVSHNRKSANSSPSILNLYNPIDNDKNNFTVGRGHKSLSIDLTLDTDEELSDTLTKISNINASTSKSSSITEGIDRTERVNHTSECSVASSVFKKRKRRKRKRKSRSGVLIAKIVDVTHASRDIAKTALYKTGDNMDEAIMKIISEKSAVGTSRVIEEIKSSTCGEHVHEQGDEETSTDAMHASQESAIVLFKPRDDANVSTDGSVTTHISKGFNNTVNELSTIIHRKSKISKTDLSVSTNTSSTIRQIKCSSTTTHVTEWSTQLKQSVKTKKNGKRLDTKEGLKQEPLPSVMIQAYQKGSPRKKYKHSISPRLQRCPTTDLVVSLRPKREVPICGIPGCNNGFNDGEMYLCLLSVDSTKKPPIASSFPKHIICKDCYGTWSPILLESNEFNNFKNWYHYELGSSIDYGIKMKVATNFNSGSWKRES